MLRIYQGAPHFNFQTKIIVPNGDKDDGPKNAKALIFLGVA